MSALEGGVCFFCAQQGNQRIHLRDWLGHEKLKIKRIIINLQQRQAVVRHRHLRPSASAVVLACSTPYSLLRNTWYFIVIDGLLKCCDLSVEGPCLERFGERCCQVALLWLFQNLSRQVIQIDHASCPLLVPAAKRTSRGILTAIHGEGYFPGRGAIKPSPLKREPERLHETCNPRSLSNRVNGRYRCRQE